MCLFHIQCPWVRSFILGAEVSGEVEAIVGLDMAVPDYYDEMNINIPIMRLGQYCAGLGITRCLPSLAESDAIKSGTLSQKEKEIYRAIFYQRTATVTMIDEAKAVKRMRVL